MYRWLNFSVLLATSLLDCQFPLLSRSILASGVPICLLVVGLIPSAVGVLLRSLPVHVS